MKKIVRRIKDLPFGFTIPNECPSCGEFIRLDMPSKMIWVTDDTVSGTVAFCCRRCANKYMEEENK